MSDVFTDPTTSDTDHLAALVGEGKKYQTVEALAKSRVDADNYIEQLKRENAEARTELAARLSVEEALRKAQNERNTEVPPKVATENTTPSATPAPTDKEFVNRIREVTQQLNQEQQAAANVNQVASKLVEIYGTQEKANEVVRQKAVELGVSTEFLQSTAAQSPKAFFQTVGLVDVAPTATPGKTPTGVNPAVLANNTAGSPKQGTYDYYEAIRASNPKLYFSPKIQNEMMKQALAQGDSFYSK